MIGVYAIAITAAVRSLQIFLSGLAVRQYAHPPVSMELFTVYNSKPIPALVRRYGHKTHASVSTEICLRRKASLEPLGAIFFGTCPSLMLNVDFMLGRECLYERHQVAQLGHRQS